MNTQTPYYYYDIDLLVHFTLDKEMIYIVKRSIEERPNTLLIPIRDGECIIF